MSSRSSNSTTLAVLCVSLISLGVVGYCIYGTKTKTVDHKGFKEHKSDSVTEGAAEVIRIIDCEAFSLMNYKLNVCIHRDNIYVHK
jgi:hypothetical protein